MRIVQKKLMSMLVSILDLTLMVHIARKVVVWDSMIVGQEKAMNVLNIEANNWRLLYVR